LPRELAAQRVAAVERLLLGAITGRIQRVGDAIARTRGVGSTSTLPLAP